MKLTLKADTKDFDDAIKRGKIKPPDPAKAKVPMRTTSPARAAAIGSRR